MSGTSRILVAAIVAPLAPAALLAVLSPSAAFVAGIYGYSIFLVLGLPTVSALRRFGKLTISSLIFSGAVIGLVSFLCFSVGLAKLLGSPASDAIDSATCFWGAGLGALVAGCFGAIAGLHNLRTSAAAEA